MAAIVPPPPKSPMPGGATSQSTYVTTTEAIKLAPELNSSITTILRSKDPLDAQEFSSVEYINKIFPNGKKPLLCERDLTESMQKNSTASLQSQQNRNTDKKAVIAYVV